MFDICRITINYLNEVNFFMAFKFLSILFIWVFVGRLRPPHNPPPYEAIVGGPTDGALWHFERVIVLVGIGARQFHLASGARLRLWYYRICWAVVDVWLIKTELGNVQKYIGNYSFNLKKD